MSSLLKTVAGVLVFVSLAGVEPGVIATAADPGPVPLYRQQLKQYVLREQQAEAGADTGVRFFWYTVQRGDSLHGIARRFGTDVETLVRLNRITNRNMILTGQVIEVLTVSGAVHAVQEGETLRDIALLYGVEPGSILTVHARPAGGLPARGERLIIPGAKSPATVARKFTFPAFRWPLHGRLTSGFGWRPGGFHYGIDLAAPLQTPFYAAAAGKVVFTAPRGSYGLLVEIDHGDGWLTRYAHAADATVQPGVRVEAGQLLGRVGMTGNTTGPHLHFEVIRDGERLDPLMVLP